MAWGFVIIFKGKINSGDRLENRFRLVLHLTVFLYNLLLDCSLDRAGNKKTIVIPCSPIIIMRCIRLELLNKLKTPQVTFFFIFSLAFQVSLIFIKRTRAVLRHTLSLKMMPQPHFVEKTSQSEPLPNCVAGLNNYARQ